MDYLGGSRPRLSIVIPVYRGEECLEALVSEIRKVMVDRSLSYEVILVNDFSPDNSWRAIESLCKTSPNLVGVDLRRNFGQDSAILTGIRFASGEYVGIMDDDLQHHPAYLPDLLAEIEKGSDVVYADFRSKHQKAWKNAGSWLNGKVAEWVIGKPRDIYLSPYKILRKDVADLIARYEGPDPYIDGLLFQVTARVSQIPIEHHPRFAGSSSYTFWKSLNVAARLAWSFSAGPLRLVTFFGFSFSIMGLLLALFVIIYKLTGPATFTSNAVGWASLMVALLLAAGIQLIFLGVIGEYVGRTFLTVGQKPQSAIRTVVGQKKHSGSIPSADARILSDVAGTDDRSGFIGN